MDELLDLFQLAAAADRPALTYSGGMRRRLDVAMGLIHRPEVLFLDEPTTGLDPESRSVMWKEVRRLAQGGLTLLLTTHYLEEADQLAQRLAIVDGGRIVAAGTPDELKGRLRGDVVSVELTDRDRGRTAEAEAVLRDQEEVAGVMVDGTPLGYRLVTGVEVLHPTYRATFEQLGGRFRFKDVQAMYTSADPAVVGLDVAQVALSRPSLEDVYLTATGHAYREEGEPAAAAPRSGR